MDELIYTLKQQIIEALNLEDMTPEDIDENASLFGEGLGLDSIDALELIVLMEKNYGIKLKDPNQGKEIFKSVAVMADYIQKNRTKSHDGADSDHRHGRRFGDWLGQGADFGGFAGQPLWRGSPEVPQDGT